MTELAAQSSAIDSPAPASSRRISGKPIPITDDWVAVDAVDEPSAQAVECESARHRRRLTAADVRVQIARRRGAEPDRGDGGVGRSPRNCIVLQPNHAVPGVQLARGACHLLPPQPRRFWGRRLAPQFATAVQHRITADHNTIGSDSGIEDSDDGLGFGGGQRCGDLTGRGPRLQPGHDGVLVDTGDDDERIDPGLAQHLTTTGRCRCEDEPRHRCRMCVRSSSVTRCQLKVV